ncbi:hypothetical protein AVEN_58561-1 [Araneus ventricosus]|uniref:Uncharacterized protein n=1 Tax=Araneus ventricosus TaxID=182803 RepID=A0A4Y2QM33_ARAVE|nr:hypothetical protein AVEN_250644-1 [Araneus ventricosus]GBN62774.1 hypothetical protein AVEN_252650-1 [Araneus ventricosus]GBN64376.1 hypothetical protein AVEN_39187-1 [Araneus ventricosus]GBN64382.1 hypothetical protein AVEN_58561-1 [Araneus ventricosus]
MASICGRDLQWMKEDSFHPLFPCQSTSHRFAMGLKSGLCGSKFKCENELSCSWNQFPTIAQIITLSQEACRVRASVAVPSPVQQKDPQIITLSQEACRVGTVHGGCSASSASSSNLDATIMLEESNSGLI